MLYFVSESALFPGESYQLSTVDDMIEYLDTRDSVQLDSETKGMDAYTCPVVCFQLGDFTHQWVIDWNSCDRKKIKDFIERKPVILHNAKFDLNFLYRHGIIPFQVFDTMLAEQVINNGMPIHLVKKGLAEVLSRRLGVGMDKSVRDLIAKEGLTERVIKYAGEDVKHLHSIRASQYEDLKEKDLVDTAILENRFVRVLAYVEHCGIRIDEEKWKERTDKDIDLLHEKERYLNSYVKNNYQGTKFMSPQIDIFTNDVECDILWSSPKQVEKFFRHLGVNTLTFDKQTKKEKRSVAEDVIGRQAKDFPIITPYLDFKAQDKLVGTYGYNFFKHISPITGRIHTRFNQLMDTGRISSGGKNKQTKEEYVNLQNIPKEEVVRSCFIPNPGNKFIISDFSGQENIILVNKSLDPELLHFYDEGLGDMHSFVASKIFPELAGLSLKEIKEHHSEKRQLAKSASFAIAYGGNGNTLSENLGISIEEGNRIYEEYFKSFPGLKSYFKKVQEDTYRRGYVLIDNLVRRKCFIHGFKDFQRLKARIDRKSYWDEYRKLKRQAALDEKEGRQIDEKFREMRRDVRQYFQAKGEYDRMSLNYPIQGEGASMTKIAAIYFFEEILKRDKFGIVLIPNLVHDEIVAECPADMAEEWKDILHDCMLRAGALFCKRIPMNAETKISDKWVK